MRRQTPASGEGTPATPAHGNSPGTSPLLLGTLLGGLLALPFAAHGSVTPTGRAGAAPSGPIGMVDSLAGSASQSSTMQSTDTLVLSGWAADSYDNGPARTVQVFVDGVAVGTAAEGLSRPDVSGFYGNPAWSSTGWSLSLRVSTLSAGPHTVEVRATDSLGLTNTLNGPRAITIRSGAPPVGTLDHAGGTLSQTFSLTAADTLTVSGWAADYSDNGPAKAVQIAIDGAVVGTATPGLPRPDVSGYFGNPAWINSGWSFTMPATTLSIGTHTVTAKASDSQGLTAGLNGSQTILVSYTSAQVIKHVVVLFDENVSFDHYFATYPRALNPSGEPAFTALAGTPTPAGLSGALLTANPNSFNSSNGAAAQNPFRLDRQQAATADQDHDYRAEQLAFDNGRMDEFPYSVGRPDSSQLANSTGAPAILASNALTMGYYDGNTVTALWNYAQRYALNDHFFESTFGPSTPGALNLVSGQTNGVVNDAGASSLMVADGSGSGYTLLGDADPTGDVCGSASTSVHMTGTNLGDLLTAAQVSWGFFQGGFDLTATNPNGSTGCFRNSTSLVTGVGSLDYVPHHQPFQYYSSTANPNHTRPRSTQSIGANSDTANHQYDLHDFFDALAIGNMPAVSILKAPAYQDGHAGYSDPLDEQTFLVNTVNTIQQSPLWQSTAIVIAYDDSDGWYDHLLNVVNGSQTTSDALVSSGLCSSATAAPGNALAGAVPSTPHAQGRCGYGPRLPLLVLSPWAKSNFVDSGVTDQTSIARFVEDVFLGGRRLGNGSFDALAGSLENMLNLTSATPGNPLVTPLDPATGLPR